MITTLQSAPANPAGQNHPSIAHAKHCHVCAVCCVVLQAASAEQQPNYLGRKDPPTGRTSSSSSSDQPSMHLKGVLELGGGSLQVTFLPDVPPPTAEASPLALPSLGNGRLYSRSFDGLGLQVRPPSGVVWSLVMAGKRGSLLPSLSNVRLYSWSFDRLGLQVSFCSSGGVLAPV
jgi:hypothetical protein